MSRWNNFKHLKRNFGFVILNMLLLAIAFLYIPVSTLVMIATIPAVIYSFYTKRWSLIIVVIAIYSAVIFIFIACIMNPNSIIELGRNLNILFHLYKSIYPYEINISILSLLGMELAFYMTLFIFFTLFIGLLMKVSEFSEMITFSFGILLFNGIYLIINVFSFIIPQMQYYMITNALFQFVFTFFYIILPYLSLNLMVLYFELILLDHVKRRDYEIEAKMLNKNNKKITLSNLLKGIAIITLILFAIIFIGGIIA